MGLMTRYRNEDLPGFMLSLRGSPIYGEQDPDGNRVTVTGGKDLVEKQGPGYPDPGYPGTGDGLTIARRIIGVHGRTIPADSDGPGKGTTFRITLPVVACPEKHD